MCYNLLKHSAKDQYNMLKEERIDFILTRLKSNDFIKIKDIANQLDVSTMTIRRDLDELEKDNLILKVHGGARLVSTVNAVKTTTEKIQLEILKKEYIGKVLNSYITENSIIFLPAGTTIYYSLPFIDKHELVIITNSLITFNYLSQNTNYSINLVAGEYIKTTNEFVGSYAESFFKNINIDLAFASTNGIFNDAATTSSSKQVELQREVFKHSRKKYLVADSTKFNKCDMYTSCTLSELDGVITDNEISNELKKYYSKFAKIITTERSEYNDNYSNI